MTGSIFAWLDSVSDPDEASFRRRRLTDWLFHPRSLYDRAVELGEALERENYAVSGGLAESTDRESR